MDIAFFEWMGTIHSQWLTPWMIALSTMNNKGVVWIILCLLLFVPKSTRRFAIVLGAGLIVVTIFGEGLIKHLVMRPRPFITFNKEILINHPRGYSFPSGHTASSMTVLGIFYLRMRKYLLPIALLAVGISFSRLYLQVHYLTDVLAGTLLGFVVAYGVDAYFKKVWKE